MDIVLYMIRDKLVGTYYFIYAFVLLFLMFSIIGYLYKQKYGKLDIKLAGSQDNAKKDKLSKNVESNKRETKITNQQVISKEKSTETPTSNVVNVTNKEAVNNNQDLVKPEPMPNPTNNSVPTPTPMPNTNGNQIPVKQLNDVQSKLNVAIPEIK